MIIYEKERASNLDQLKVLNLLVSQFIPTNVRSNLALEGAHSMYYNFSWLAPRKAENDQYS